MSVDQAWNNDGVLRFDHLSVRDFELRRDRCDPFASYQYISSGQVANLAI